LYSTAIGYGAEANGKNSTAIGYNAQTSHDNEIVLGTSDNTVYIPGNLVVMGDVRLSSTGHATYVWAPKNGFYSILNRATGGDGNQTWYSADKGTVTIGDYSFRVKKSDRRLKNVGEKFTGGLAELKQLDLYNYTFKKDEAKTPRVGVMAQDLQKVFPNAVAKGEDGYLRVRMEDMFYAAINAIKELDAKIAAVVQDIKNLVCRVDKQDKLIEAQQKTIEEQQTLIEELEKQNKDFENRIEKLEKSAK